MNTVKLALALIVTIALACVAQAQGSLLQGGAWTPGHAPMYSSSGGSQPVVIDSGPAGGAATGVGFSELLQVSRAPGTGPLGSHVCFYDNPLTAPAGYHYLCFDASAQNAGLIAFGYGGSASPQAVNVNVNGTNVVLPAAPGTIWATITGTITAGDPVCFNSTTGVLKDCGGAAGTGTVTQVATGAGLSGGPITTTGTISCSNATVGATGCIKPDNVTISVSGSGTLSTVSTVNSVTAGGNVSPSACGSQVRLSGAAFYNANLTAAGGYTSPCVITFYNDDVASGRAKFISASGWTSPAGYAGIYLWPGQQVVATATAGNWYLTVPSQWKMPTGTFNLYTNYQSGNDTFGATDGRDPGTPLKTGQAAFSFAQDQFCFNAISATKLTINFAPAMNDQQGLHLPAHDFCGAQGGAGIIFNGATKPIVGATNNGSGAIRLQVDSTSTYVTNEEVSVYGVSGTTEANAAWKITVVDPTHLDLQGSTFSNVYASGGTITNGSGIATTGVDAVATYFSTTIQLGNLQLNTATSGNNLSVLWHSNVYLLDGMIFGVAPTAHINLQSGAHLETQANYGIGAAATYHIVALENATFQSSSTTIQFVPGTGESFTAFVLADRNATLTFGPVTSTGATVAGYSFIATGNSVILTTPGSNPNTDLPGSSPGFCQTGGQVGVFCAPDYPVIFSTLPSCGINYKGQQRTITDGNSNTWGATVAGGGANVVRAFCDGTNWTVAAK